MENNTDALPRGTRLNGSYGIFEIIDKLGQGGFGITYKADLLVNGKFGLTRSGAVVAVKEFFISDINTRRGTEVTGTEGRKFAKILSKFERESRLLSGLDHPGICHVQDAFRANGTAYYVMDYYGGGSLDALIRRAPGGALSEATALRYVREISSALSYLHTRQLAHLDLKPQNIMIKPDGSLVLIDFGISKMFDEDGQFQTSDTMGGSTPGYAPLEQTNYSERTGDPHLMDIYALGATLYRMLAGQKPPTAADVNNYGLPLEPLRAKGVSEATIAVIVKAMQPRKADRYQSVDLMLRALPETKEAPKDDDVTIVAVEEPRQPSNATPSKNSDNSPKKESFLRNPVLISTCVLLAIMLGIIFWPKTYGHSEPANFELCTETGGEVYYFSPQEWNEVPSSEKSKYNRWGIYIPNGEEPFLLNLWCSEPMNWIQAKSSYGESLPSKEQAKAMGNNRKAINTAIKAFGGEVPPENYFWTKTEQNPGWAWNVSMVDGYLRAESETSVACRVRVVVHPPFEVRK